MNGVGFPAILVCEFEDASWVTVIIDSFVKERNLKYIVMRPTLEYSKYSKPTGIGFKIWY